MKELEILILDGAITKRDAPVYEPHPRGRNWAAIIHRDPKSPGGLGRQFLARGHGPYIYLAEAEVGDALEFGADYYSGGGKPYRKRVYALLVGKTDGRWVLEAYESLPELWAAQKGLVDRKPGVARVITLEKECAN